MALKSPKAKGSRLERKVAGLIRSKCGIEAYRTPLSGAFWNMKGDITSPKLPFAIECKNSERFNLWKYWEQTTEQATYKKPLLVHSANHRPIMATLLFEDLLDLIKENMELWDDRTDA